MTVEHGMDTARARSIAGQLRKHGSALDTLGAQGSAMMQLLDDVWNGPDGEHFAREWQSARPQIDHAGRAVADLGQELVRQADEQDLASEASGLGPGFPTPPVLPLPPIPKLPSLPDVFGAIQDILGSVWDFLRGFAYSIPVFISDVLGLLDEWTTILKNSKWLKWLSLPLKILGKVTPFISAVVGLWDLGESIYRFFTEGFSKDSVLQFFQGLTGTIGPGLGIAALFATGTIFGAPAGLVLGIGAAIFGGISIAIGIYREFDEEIDAAAKWAWDHGLIGGPLLNPNAPGPGFPLPLPQFPPPTVPVPEWPTGPGAPTPTIPWPQPPSLPGIPTPTFPKVPSLPALPDLPTLPKPTFPGVPVPRLW